MPWRRSVRTAQSDWKNSTKFCVLSKWRMLCQYKVLGSNYSRFHFVYRAHLTGLLIDTIRLDFIFWLDWIGFDWSSSMCMGWWMVGFRWIRGSAGWLVWQMTSGWSREEEIKYEINTDIYCKRKKKHICWTTTTTTTSRLSLPINYLPNRSHSPLVIKLEMSPPASSCNCRSNCRG